MAKAVEYIKLTWQYKMTFNSHDEAVNKAHATLVSTYKEMLPQEDDLQESFDKHIHSEISTIRRNLRDMVDDVTINFEHEQAASVEVINTLKRKMMILMEKTFEADFA